MLELRRLRLLRELAERGTINAVADALRYTPSAVSQQLAVLEREAGVPLLERSGRNVRLTDAGRTLVAHAEALLERVEQAEADLEAASRAVTGTVRIASFQTAALYLVTPAVERLARTHPALRVELTEAEPEAALPALALGGWDLVLADEYDGAPRPRDARLRAEPLLHERVLLFLPETHPLAARERVPLRALAGEAWALAHPGTHHADMLVRTCRDLGGFEPDLRHRSNDLLILLFMVGAGGAVTLLPELVPVSARPGVVAREVAERPLGRTVFSVIRRGSERRPALRAVRAALQEIAR